MKSWYYPRKNWLETISTLNLLKIGEQWSNLINFDSFFLIFFVLLTFRRKGLHEYIQFVLHHPKMRSSLAVKEFIANDTTEQDVEIENGTDCNGQGQGEKNKVSLDDFYLLKVIGKGSFGKVFIFSRFFYIFKSWIQTFKVMLAKHKKNGKVFAVKVISKRAVKQRDEVKHIMAGELKNTLVIIVVELKFSFIIY